MERAKIFANGGSQAVRLPKDCRFEGEKVLINRIGNVVILMPESDPWEAMMTGLDMFTDDFLSEPIEELPMQEREDI